MIKVLPVELKQIINADLAHHFEIIPKKYDQDSIVFFISEEKYSLKIQSELNSYLGKRVELEKIPADDIKKALFQFYRLGEMHEPGQGFKENEAKDSYLEKVIEEAQATGSSDIHFESFENSARVRFRLDGVLIEKYIIPVTDYLELVNRIKIKANLDITERRLPQDGRINSGKFDLRVSILPTLHGEKIVLRILSRDASSIDIESLGMDRSEQNIFLRTVKKPNGIILISGPTGSGKTTTLYATLKLLNDSRRNIMTVEDPIEYTLEGINQVQLKENIGLTFSSTLRSFLRQDPDIIMLGEIRDRETAQMAIRASLTGHLVLSTIHTNSAEGTITRLLDMDVPSYYISETLNLSVAQRLLRLLCDDCKKEEIIDLGELPNDVKGFIDFEKHFKPVGCKTCHYTGYRSRMAIYEMLPVTREVVSILKRGEGLDPGQYPYGKLPEKALNLYKNGKTSLEEIYSLLLKN